MAPWRYFNEKSRLRYAYRSPSGFLQQEAPPGFEPGMSDLQSDALATWLRRLRY